MADELEMLATGRTLLLSPEDRLPEDYGTPAYESRWVRNKLGLQPEATTCDVQGQLHVLESNASGYVRYIQAFKCDDKQGEIARQHVRIAELEAITAALKSENRAVKLLAHDSQQEAIKCLDVCDRISDAARKCRDVLWACAMSGRDSEILEFNRQRRDAMAAIEPYLRDDPK